MVNPRDEDTVPSYTPPEAPPQNTTPAPPEPVPQTTSEQVITGQVRDPRINQLIGDGTPGTSPISNTNYDKYRIQGSAENRKETVASEATNLSHGQDEIARINREAEAEQRRMLFGNPEELLKAHQALQAAQALPPDHPDKQLQTVQAQDSIMKNTGAQPLLVKAMEDVKARDESLRADIQKAHAYSQSKAAEVDPERYWNNKSTGGKIAAGIGMVLSGMGGGMTGSNRNLALEQLNKAVDDDISAQRQNINTHIEGNWKAIADKHQLNQDAFNNDLHRQVWENNFRTSALETIKLKLGASAAATQSETVKNNALNFIQTLTDEQMKIRNDQWKLGVQAQQAQLNRMRALSKEADGDVQKIMEKDGVVYQDAVDAVYNRPHYRELIGAGMAPPETARLPALRLEAGKQLEALKAGGMKEDDAMKQLTEDPKFAPLFKKQGVIVPFKPSEKGIESEKELDARTVGWSAASNGMAPQRILAADPGQAGEYKAKMGAAQQWEHNAAELKALSEKSEKSGLSNADLAKWQALRTDMIAIYGVMKEGSKKLPNQAEAERLEKEIIGNPPNQGAQALNPFSDSGSTALTTHTDLGSQVKVRMENLASISEQARKAAGLALQQSSGPATPAASKKDKDVGPLPSYAKPAKPGK